MKKQIFRTEGRVINIMKTACILANKHIAEKTLVEWSIRFRFNFGTVTTPLEGNNAHTYIISLK